MNRRLHDDAQAFDEAWSDRARGLTTVRDAEIADLVAAAEQICLAATIEPSAVFRSSLREQLMTEAATVLSPAGSTTRLKKHRRLGWRRGQVRVPSYALRRRLAGVTAALVTAASFIGLVGTSAEALPGEMLYPVKRGVENVELAFHKDDLTRGQFRLAQASERLAEARRLTDSGSPQSQSHVAGVLDAFAVQAKDGSSALFRDYGRSGSEQPITVVNDFSAAAAADLAQLAGNVPSDATDSFQAAADTVTALVTKASTLCTTCASADVPGLAGAVSSLGTPKSADPTGGPTAAQSSESPPESDGSAPKITVPTLPLVQQPATSPAQDAPQLADVTDPAVGDLLGDADQPGLVGGLVDGLLGGTEK
jgi:uncharacterized protein DUF5667